MVEALATAAGHHAAAVRLPAIRIDTNGDRLPAQRGRKRGLATADVPVAADGRRSAPAAPAGARGSPTGRVRVRRLARDPAVAGDPTES